MSAGEWTTSTRNSEIILARVSTISSGLPKPLSTIADPAAASARAMPSPMPLVDPVTSDTLPSSEGVADVAASGACMFMT